MGIIFTMPRPQMFATIMTAIATTATSQFVEAFAMAELERIRPIEMTIGPVTTGGKNFITRSAPKPRKSAESTR